MERRELLKALAIAPFTRLPFNGKEVDAVEVAPHKYWVFIDDASVDVDAFVGPWPWPGCDAEIFPVKCYGGRTVQDVVQIYKIADDEKKL